MAAARQPDAQPVNPFADPARMRAAGEHVLQVHLDLRREMITLLGAVEGFVSGRVDEPQLPTQTPTLAQHCLSFCEALEGHHTGEDGALGPLEQQLPELAPVVAKIRAEHSTVSAGVARIRELVGHLGPHNGERVRAELAQLTAELGDHFDYEERELLPAMGVTVSEP